MSKLFFSQLVFNLINSNYSLSMSWTIMPFISFSSFVFEDQDFFRQCLFFYSSIDLSSAYKWSSQASVMLSSYQKNSIEHNLLIYIIVLEPIKNHDVILCNLILSPKNIDNGENFILILRILDSSHRVMDNKLFVFRFRWDESGLNFLDSLLSKSLFLQRFLPSVSQNFVEWMMSLINVVLPHIIVVLLSELSAELEFGKLSERIGYLIK